MALAIGVAFNSGCSIVRRAESFSEAFRQNFNAEYTWRSDPNAFSNDKYRALQELGEIQRRVEYHTLERTVALEQIECEELDAQALRAVRAIAQHAAQNALRSTLLPEINVAENLPNTSIREISGKDSILDFLHPRVSTSVSISSGMPRVEPSFSLGPYRITYDITDRMIHHRISYHYMHWNMGASVEHDLHAVQSANIGVGYLFDPFTGVSIGYSYAPDNHTVSFGFSTRF